MHKTGTYEAQIGGYAAFMPAPLPDGTAFDVSSLYAMISQADRAVARLDGSIHTIPDPDLFVLSYIRKEAVVSSQIEGTQASLSDVLKAEASVLDPARPADVGEVVNHVKAMRYAVAETSRIPITTNLLCQMHERLMRGVRGEDKAPGQIRTMQNWIGDEGTGIGNAVFVPPPPHMVRDCLHALERFMNEDQNLPLAVKVGLAHAQFETIHPFNDGNGRVGRMIIPLMFMRHRAISDPVLYISHYFRRHKGEYTARLQATRDGGDLIGWTEFFLKALIDVAEDATRVSRAIARLREMHRSGIIEAMPRGAGRALKLYESLFSLPIVTVKGAAATMDVTFAAANATVNKLVDLGILAEITGGQRDRAFMYETYYRLFEPQAAPRNGA